LEREIIEALRVVPGPDGRTPLPDTGMIQGPILGKGGQAGQAGQVFVALAIDPADRVRLEPMRQAVQTIIESLAGVTGALVTLTAAASPARAAAAPSPGTAGAGTGPGAGPPPPAAPIEGIGQIVAVASGKGGVGKSTCAANIALALAARGLRVGLLDADIHGPSVPRLFGVSGKPEAEGRVIQPHEKYGLKLMSMGFLVEDGQALVWRGPMLGSALNQMLREVAWGVLDVLIIDMPPGTGDIPLSLSRHAPLSGAVMVSTPQDLALIDVRRGMDMFARIKVPILGLVENMSYFLCPHCGERSDIFAHGGARHEAEQAGIAFLGEIPLAMDIRYHSDSGQPIVAVAPDSAHAAPFHAIAAQLAGILTTAS
jgi:ATP-binding protein involved in chromosome partitioning